MTDSTNTNKSGADGSVNGDGSQQRIEEMSAKVKAEAEARQKAEERASAAEKEAADARFQAQFAQVQIKPELAAAKEFENEIKEKVAKGYSVEDAAHSVLREKGRLGSASNDGDRTADIAGAGGGSAAISTTRGRESIEKKDPEKMSHDELREAVHHAESTGQIRLTS